MESILSVIIGLSSATGAQIGAPSARDASRAGTAQHTAPRAPTTRGAAVGAERPPARQRPRAPARGRAHSSWRLSPPPRTSRDAWRNTKVANATLPTSGAGDIYCQAAILTHTRPSAPSSIGRCRCSSSSTTSTSTGATAANSTPASKKSSCDRR